MISVVLHDSLLLSMAIEQVDSVVVECVCNFLVYCFSIASCKNLKCGFRQRCVHTHPAMPMKCGCPQFKCADKLNPVCGHDNVEYISICRLQEQECKSGKFIGVKNYSGCGHEGENNAPLWELFVGGVVMGMWAMWTM